MYSVILRLDRVAQAGLDSLGAVELWNAVSVKYGAELSATAIFDYPTLSALADHLIATVAGASCHPQKFSHFFMVKRSSKRI